jgi:hypothetical protein
MKNLYANSNHELDWKASNYFEVMKQNNQELDAQDEAARKENRLVGRIVQHGHADGYAVYQIVKENKKSVKIKHCHGIGDDWVLPAWGYECNIPKDILPRFLRRNLADLKPIEFKR